MNISPIKAPMNFKSAASVADDTLKKAPKLGETIKNTGVYKWSQEQFDKYVIENIAKGMGRITDLKATGKAIDQMNKWKSPDQRLCDLGSVVRTVFTVKDSIKSKKINDDRKPFMVVNNILVTAVSSTLAGLIDRFSYEPQRQISNAFIQGYAKKVTPDFVREYIANPKNASFVKEKNLKELMENSDIEEAGRRIIMKNYDKFAAGLGKFKSTFIFTSIVRFLVPVAFIPITAKIIDKLEARAKEKKNQKTNETQKEGVQNPVNAAPQVNTPQVNQVAAQEKKTN